jgi:hypothetical protein
MWLLVHDKVLDLDKIETIGVWPLIFLDMYYLEGKLTFQLQHNVSSLSYVVHLPDLYSGEVYQLGLSLILFEQEICFILILVG